MSFLDMYLVFGHYCCVPSVGNKHSKYKIYVTSIFTCNNFFTQERVELLTVNIMYSGDLMLAHAIKL